MEVGNQGQFRKICLVVRVLHFDISPYSVLKDRRLRGKGGDVNTNPSHHTVRINTDLLAGHQPFFAASLSRNGKPAPAMMMTVSVRPILPPSPSILRSKGRKFTPTCQTINPLIACFSRLPRSLACSAA